MAFAISPRNINNLNYTGSQFYFTPCVEAPRAPTTTDWNYPLFTLWRNSNATAVLPNTEGDMWYLATFTGQGGNNHPLANWRKLASGGFGNVIGFTVPAGISPVYADINGLVNLTSTGGTITITGSTADTINFDLVGGGVGIDSVVGDDGVPVFPDGAGQLFLDTLLVANNTYPSPIYTVNINPNTQTIAYALSIANATTNNTSYAGISYFDDSIFTVNNSGYVSMVGGSHPALQSITGDDTVIVYADATGNIDLTTSIVANATNATPIFTTSGGASNETIELQLSTTSATTNDENLAGICYFDDSQFTVNADGYVSLVGGGGSGSIVQQVRTSSTTSVSSTATLGITGTTPTTANTASVITLAITPTSSTDILYFQFTTVLGADSDTTPSFHLFEGSTYVTSKAYWHPGNGLTDAVTIDFDYYRVSGTTAATTFDIRMAHNGNPAISLKTLQNGNGTALFNAAGNTETQFTITQVVP